MKLHSVLLALALMAAAQSVHSRDGAAHDSNYRPAEAFTEFDGLEVRNMQNEKLGTVKFITMDVHNARLVEVVVKHGGGLFGLGSASIAVPPRALSLDEPAQVLRLDASKARFASAPRFDASHMRRETQCERVAEVNRYFGLEPWFYLEGQTVRKNAEILELGHIERGTDILRLTVVDTRGAHIGRMSALRMDLPKGQIVHVVVNTNAELSPRRVIQPRALRYNDSHTRLILDDTPDELADQPHFRWADGSHTSYQEESFVNRDTGAGSREQGLNFRDRQKTSRIQQAIRSEQGLASGSSNVRVTVLNAQVTLSGHVGSTWARQRIGAIATSAGRAENVSNLLEVRP